jgi:hypothetical protein
MSRLLLTFLDMLRLRSGPQDLPASHRLMIVLAVLYIAGGFIAGSVLSDADYAPRAMVAIGIQFGFVILLLNFKGLGDRIQQTISALAGTGFIFGMVSVYLLSLVDVEKPQVELVAFYMVLFFWSLAVDGHIYRHALSSKMGTGLLVAVTIFAINFVLLRLLFGQ